MQQSGNQYQPTFEGQVEEGAVADGEGDGRREMSSRS